MYGIIIFVSISGFRPCSRLPEVKRQLFLDITLIAICTYTRNRGYDTCTYLVYIYAVNMLCFFVFVCRLARRFLHKIKFKLLRLVRSPGSFRIILFFFTRQPDVRLCMRSVLVLVIHVFLYLPDKLKLPCILYLNLLCRPCLHVY